MLAAVTMVAISAIAEPMMTQWGEKVTAENAWRSYPRPQMVRANWTNLNGEWDYAVTSVTNTPGRPEKWDGKILVPFPLESALSGVGRLLKPDEFLWYTRKIECDPKPGERILLHFGGVDFRTMVFVGHEEVTDVPHEGGQNPFTVDITEYVKKGENELTVCVWDPTEDFVNSRGKQSFEPKGCFYTRVSGIWQTVWMETVPEKHIRSYKVFTDIDKGTVRFEFDKVEGAGEVQVTTDMPKDFECWSPENPKLYTFTARYGKDEIKGYFGMRKIEKRKDWRGHLRFFLNNKPYFMIGTLDQGWWPDGLLTPPSEAAMEYDVRVLKDCGFNMLRKHIKVEPQQYYAMCDRLGLLVIQDLPSGARDPHDPMKAETVKRYWLQRQEMIEMMDDLQPFTSIIMWNPYNEGWGQPGEFLTHSMLDFTKRHDPTRLVNGPSGCWDWEGGHLLPGGWQLDKRVLTQHRADGVCEAADTVDAHFYRGPWMFAVNDRRISFLGEFGGLGHSVPGHLWKESKDGNGNWGYGGIKDTKARMGLEKTYLGLMDKLGELAERGLGGSVYTQTSDVEIEINGLLTYDRKVVKFNEKALAEAHDRVRAAFTLGTTPHESKVFAKRLDPDVNAWAWTTTVPAADWEKPGFDDSAWARSAGGFGNKSIMKNHPHAKCATKWETPEIWLRRHFTYTKPAGKILRATIEMFHDEDAEVYLNGELILSAKGYNTNWTSFSVPEEKFDAAVKEGDNVIAVKVIQSVGGQFIDLGLSVDIAK